MSSDPPWPAPTPAPLGHMASSRVFSPQSTSLSPAKLHPILCCRWLLSEPGSNLSIHVDPKAVSDMPISYRDCLYHDSLTGDCSRFRQRHLAPAIAPPPPSSLPQTLLCINSQNPPSNGYSINSQQPIIIKTPGACNLEI